MKTLFINLLLLGYITLSSTLPNAFDANSFIENYNLQKPSSKSISITNDDLVSRFLDELEYSKVINKYHPKDLSRKTVKNQYDSKVKDIIESFTANDDKFSFYKAKDKNLLLTMELNKRYMILDKDIYIGCDKNVFKTRYKTALNSDIIIIEDLEGGNIFSFFFKNNKLVRASYKCDYLE